jgi:cytochrome c oxidase subunit 4
MARDIKETLPDYQGKDSDLIRPEAIPGGSGAATATYDEFHADEHHHVVPLSTYYKIFGALMVLLLITVGAAEIPFERIIPAAPWLNIVVALAVAITKAALIVMYFMHVKYSSRLVMIVSVTAYFFVFIMFMLTYADYFTRGWMPQAGK